MDDLVDLNNTTLFGGGNLFEYMKNLMAEIQVIEAFGIEILAVSVGLIISGTAVFDVIRMKNPKYAQKVTPGSIATRMVFGPIAILLVPFMSAVTESIFGDRSPATVPRAMTYSQAAQNAEDPLSILLLFIVGFLVFVGWLTALRAVMAFARCGNPQQDGYQLAKAGGARLIAATILTMFQYFMDDLFEAATGDGNTFSSKLNV